MAMAKCAVELVEKSYRNKKVPVLVSDFNVAGNHLFINV